MRRTSPGRIDTPANYFHAVQVLIPAAGGTVYDYRMTTRVPTAVSANFSYAWLVATLAALALPKVYADSFSSAYYDGKTNELVVTMVYGGTNPDHQFTIHWDECQTLGDDGDRHQIVGTVTDSEWNDADTQDTFTKTVRFGLAEVNCRPVTVTLRTAPRFEYTLQVP